MKSFQGRVVVITDSGCDLGKFLAHEFARIGARLALWTHDLAFAQQVADHVVQVNTRAVVRVYEVDLASCAAIQQAAKNVRRDFGQVDVLVNNTDFLHGATLQTASDESLERVFALNTLATIYATQAVLPQMLQANYGVLVNFGTSADSLGTPKLVDYCASKFAVMGFHEALRHELRHEQQAYNKKNKKQATCGIAMTLVCPTLILAQRGAQMPADGKSMVLSIWMQPDVAAKEIVRAVRRNKEKLVLPPDYSMVSGLLSVLPTTMATWVRNKLRLSKAMDHFVAPTAGGFAHPSV